MNVKELREKTEMNRRQFSEYFGIPYRTVEDWENGKRVPAIYIIDLMEYKLTKEKKLVR